MAQGAYVLPAAGILVGLFASGIFISACIIIMIIVMKELVANDLQHFSCGFEKGVIGKTVCSSLGGFISSTVGIGATLFLSVISPHITAFTFGISAGCALSDIIR